MPIMRRTSGPVVMANDIAGSGPLLVVGDEDVVTPPADSALLTRNIPGAKLVTIRGAGHLTNIEQPEAFNTVLETVLTFHASRASVVSLAGA
jgi:pimeloyl-ACP methyl ester carboxylesterase